MVDPFELQSYKLSYDLYRRNPFLFSDSDIASLEKRASALGLPFSRNPQGADFSLAKTVTQFFSGFASGFTTLNIGDDPGNTTEAIVRNIGHLLGFIGFIPGIGTAGSIAAKGVSATMKAARLGKFIEAGTTGAKLLSRAERFTSVPMGVADWAVRHAGGVLKHNAALTAGKFLRTGSIGRHIIRDAAHLGIASAVSSWQNGVDEMLHSAVGGAVAGGVFAGIGNVVQLQRLYARANKIPLAKIPMGMRSKLELSNKIVRSMSAAMFMGIPSSSRNEPIELQVYQYLLGGIFGWRQLPAYQREVVGFAQSHSKGDLINIARGAEEQVKDFANLTKDAQDELRRQAQILFVKDADFAPQVLAKVLAGVIDKPAKEHSKTIDKIVADELTGEKTDTQTGEIIEPDKKVLQGKDKSAKSLASKEKIFYHGTPKFVGEDFNPAMLGDNTGADSAYEGFFFTSNPEVAKTYMRTIKSVNKSPFDNFDATYWGDIFYRAAKNLPDKEFNYVFEDVFDFDVKKPTKNLKEARNKFIENIQNWFNLYSTKGDPSIDIYPVLHDVLDRIDDLPKHKKENLLVGSEAKLIAVKITTDNIKKVDWGGKKASSRGKFTRTIKQAKKEGYDAIRFKDIKDAKGESSKNSEVVVVFDPKNIQRVYPPDTAGKPTKSGQAEGGEQTNSYKTGKIYNKQGKEIFAGIIDGQVYINKDLIDKYSNKEILDNQSPILNTVLKNLHVYNRLINLSRDQFIDFLVEHEKAHLDFEKEKISFKTDAIEEVYANAKALINIGILQNREFDLTRTNEIAKKLSKHLPNKEKYINDMVDLVAKEMDNAKVDLESKPSKYKSDEYKGSLWGKKIDVSSLDDFYFLSSAITKGKSDVYVFPKNKKELKKAISEDIARNIPQFVAKKYWKKMLDSLSDEEKHALVSWAYYNNIRAYTSQYGKQRIDLKKDWNDFVFGLQEGFDATGNNLWFANLFLSDAKKSVATWYKNLTPEKFNEHINKLSKAMAFKSMVVSSIKGGGYVSAASSRARNIESLIEAYYEIKQKTKLSPLQVKSKKEQSIKTETTSNLDRFTNRPESTSKSEPESPKTYGSIEEAIENHETEIATIKQPLERVVMGAIKANPKKYIKDDGSEDIGAIRQLKTDIYKAYSSIITDKGKAGFDDFVKEVTQRANVPLEKMRPGLRQFWVRESEGKKVNELFYNGVTIKPIGRIDDFNNPRVVYRAPSFLERLSRFKRWVLQNFIGRDRDDKIVQYGIFDPDFHGDRIFSDVKLIRSFIAADKKGLYFFSGVKDKNRTIWMPYRVDENSANKVMRLYIRDIKPLDPHFEAAYKARLKRFKALMKPTKLSDETLTRMYNRQVVSNIRWLEEINGGLSFKEMVKANRKAKLAGKREPFLLSVTPITKRMQVIDAGEYRFDPAYYKDIDDAKDGLNVIIVDALPGLTGRRKSIAGIDIIKAYGQIAKHHLDGVVVVRKDVFNQMRLDGGMTKDADILKGIITDANNQHGLLIGKFAYFQAGDRESAEMQTKNLHMKLYDTAVKQFGLREAVDTRLSADGKKQRYFKAGTVQAAKLEQVVYKMPFESFTINHGIYSSRRALKPVRIVRQALTNLFPEQVEKKLIDKVYDKIVTPSIHGRESTNSLVEDYIKNPSEEALSKIDVDDIGLARILELTMGKNVSDTPLYRKIWKHIIKTRKELDLDDYITDEMDTAEIKELTKVLTEGEDATSRILDNWDFTPVTMNDKDVRPYAETILRNYIINRSVRPRLKYSAKAVGRPFDLYLQQRFKAEGKEWRQGLFYLDDGFKRMKVRYNNKEYTLGELFEAWQKSESPEMKEALTMAVIRVPSDSVSGMRALQFNGFTGRKGYGVLLHNEDMINLGGMDLDIDSVFIYQDFPKDVLEAIKSNKDEWVKDGKLRSVKDESRKKDFKVKEFDLKEKLMTTIDPLDRWTVGFNMHSGNRLLGSAANQRRRIHTLYSYVVSKNNSKPIDLIVGPNRIVRFIPRTDNGKLFRLYARDAINYAADAGDVAGLLNRIDLGRLLLRKAFHKISYIDKSTNTIVDVKDESALRKVFPVYDMLMRVDAIMRGRNPKTNRKIALRDMLKMLKDVTEDYDDIPGTWFRTAKALGELSDAISPYADSYLNKAELMNLFRMTGKILHTPGGEWLMKKVFRRNIVLAPNYKVLFKNPDLISQELSDAISAPYLAEIANKYIKSGGTSARLEEIAEQVEYFKKEQSRLWGLQRHRRRTGDTRPKYKTFGRLYDAIESYHSKLSPIEKDWMERYFIQSLYKQDMDLADYKRAIQKEIDVTDDPAKKAELEQDLNGAENYWFRTNRMKSSFALRIVSDANIKRFGDMLNQYVKIPGQAGDRKELEHQVKVFMGLEKARSKPIQEAIDGMKNVNAQEETRNIVTPDPKKIATKELPKYSSDFMDHIHELAEREYGKDIPEEVMAELPEVVKQLQWIVKQDMRVVKIFPEFFAGVTATRQPGGTPIVGTGPEAATWQDIKDFISYHKREYGRFFMKDVPESMEVKRHHFLIFPDTLANQLTKYDRNFFILKNVVVRGKNNKYFNATVKVPLSHMSRLQQIAYAMLAKRSDDINVWTRKYDELIAFTHQFGVDGTELYRAAVALVIEPKMLEGKDISQEKYHEYVKNRQEAKAYIKSLKDRKFSIDVGGKTMHYDATETVNIIANRIEKFLNDFYKVWIRNDEKMAEVKFNKDGTINFDATTKKLADNYLYAHEIPRLSLQVLSTMDFELGIANTYVPVEPFTYPRGSTPEEIEKLRIEYDKDVRDGIIESVKVKDLPADRRKKVLQSMRSNAPKIGEIRRGFYPHNNFPKKTMLNYRKTIIERMQKDGAQPAQIAREIMKFDTAIAEDLTIDAMVNEQLVEMIMGKKLRESDLSSIGMHSIPGHAKSRNTTYGPIPEWDRTPHAIHTYIEQIISGYHNKAFAHISHNIINHFITRGVMGPQNENWTRMMQLYTRDILGYPNVLNQSWLNDKTFPVKDTPYYWLSETAALKLAKKISKKSFEGESLFVEAQKDKNFYRKLARLSNWEAKWELMTLLTHTKTMVANVLGGSENIIASVGFRHFKDALSLKSVLSKIPNGPLLGEERWRGWDDVSKWTEAQGAVESWIMDEYRMSPALRGERAGKFVQDVIAGLKKDPKMKDKTLYDIASKYGYTKRWVDRSAWFMRVAERKLRMTAFLAHYMKWREVLEGVVPELERDHTWLIQKAKRGVQNTQFLYHNAARPAFARSALGRIYSRFQLWAWNSLKFRKDVYQSAKQFGFQPNTEEFKRFKRLATADLFIFALATAFPLSIFESALPPPWSYVQDMSDIMFGNKKERDRAFYGTLPFPFSPLQAIAPPSARYVLQPLGNLLKGDWSRWASYQVWTWFPYGRLMRDVKGTIENPVMIIEKSTGIPIHKIQRQVTQERKKKALRPELPF